MSVPRVPGKAETHLTVNTDVNGALWAYAQAKDPWDFAAGMVTLDLSLGIDELFAAGAGSFAGLGYFLGSSIPGLEDIFRLNVEVADGSPPRVNYWANPAFSLSLPENAVKSFLQSHLEQRSDGTWFLNESLDLRGTFTSTTSFSVSFGNNGYAHADPVPEPDTFMLLGTALIGVGLFPRWLQRRSG